MAVGGIVVGVVVARIDLADTSVRAGVGGAVPQALIRMAGMIKEKRR